MKNFKFILGLGIAMMNMVYGQELKSPNGNFVMDFSLSKDDLNEESYAERIKRKIWQNIHLLSNNLGKSKTLEVLSRDYSKYIMKFQHSLKIKSIIIA